MIFRFVMVAAVVGVGFAEVADAQRSRRDSRSMRGAARGVSSFRGSGPRSSRSFGASRGGGFGRSSRGRSRSFNAGAALGQALSGGNFRGSGRRNTPILDALLGTTNRGGNGYGNGIGNGQLLGALGDALGYGGRGDYGRGDYGRGDYGRGDYGRRSDDRFTDAYLTVGLANAAVGLAGVFANRERPYRRSYCDNYREDTCPDCYPQAAPRRVQERVVISQPRYEQYEVWIPARYDTHTGEKLGGGYTETRTRYTPEEYAYRDVDPRH